MHRIEDAFKRRCIEEKMHSRDAAIYVDVIERRCKRYKMHCREDAFNTKCIQEKMHWGKDALKRCCNGDAIERRREDALEIRCNNEKMQKRKCN